MKFTGRNYLTVRFYKPNLCTLFTYGLTSNRSLYITIIPSITWDRGLRRIRTSVTCDKSKTGYIYSDLGFRQNLTTLIWISLPYQAAKIGVVSQLTKPIVHAT